MIDLLKVEVILQIPINWFQFLIHIALRVVAQVLESQSMTYIYSIYRDLLLILSKCMYTGLHTTYQQHECEGYLQTHEYHPWESTTEIREHIPYIIGEPNDLGQV